MHRSLLPSYTRLFLFGMLLVLFLLAKAQAAPSGGTLPRLASTVLPAADAASVAELDRALTKIMSAKAEERERGISQIREAESALLGAEAKKLSELRKSANRELMGNVIAEARKQGRRKGKSGREKDSDRAPKEPSDDPDAANESGDWLTFLVAEPKPAEGAYRDALTILALERAWVEMGTTAAVRELINVYVFFGDLFRIDVQHMLNRLGDRAVPALLEARKHDAEKVRRWAARQLDGLGKAIPGEAVQIVDPHVLADVLRAYGRTKETDALRVVVSFIANERIQVREAAREAVTSYGDAALWQLREAYETLTGQRAAPGSSWDKIATDVYHTYDQARLAEVMSLFDDGLAHYRAGRLEEMAERFDRVLARAPTLEQRADMAPGYAALARSLARNDPHRARLLGRKAVRLDPDNPDNRKWQSFVLTLDAEERLTHGLADATTLQRALELDPTNRQAKADLARLEAGQGSRKITMFRYAAAALVALSAWFAAYRMARRGAIFGPPFAERARQKEPREESSETPPES